MAIYGFVGPCRATYGYVGLCHAMYCSVLLCWSILGYDGFVWLF